MVQVFKTKEALLSKYDVSFALTELEETLKAKNWHTNFNFYVYIKDAEGFVLQAEIHPFIYAEYYSVDGKTLDDRIHIVILNEDFDWVDGYTLDEDRSKIYSKAECMQEIQEEREAEKRYHDSQEAKFDAMREDRI